MSGSTVTKLFGLGATALTGWLMHQSKQGHAPEWDRKIASHHTKLMYDQTSFGWGHWSGQPKMDHWAHKIFGLKLFGPFDLFTTYHRYKTLAEGYVNDVILPNLVPLGVGVAGLYAGFGAKTLHAPFKNMYKRLAPTFRKMHLGRKLKNALKPLSKKIGDLAVAGVKAAVKHPLGALGGIVLGGFVFNRFNRVLNHQEQEAYFRDFTTKIEH